MKWVLLRIMRLALANLQRLYSFTEQMIQDMLDSVMNKALAYFGLENNKQKELLEA